MQTEVSTDLTHTPLTMSTDGRSHTHLHRQTKRVLEVGPLCPKRKGTGDLSKVKEDGSVFSRFREGKLFLNPRGTFSLVWRNTDTEEISVVSPVPWLPQFRVGTTLGERRDTGVGDPGLTTHPGRTVGVWVWTLKGTYL